MESIVVTTEGPADAGGLTHWLVTQGHTVRPAAEPGAMGAADTILVAAAGTATIRAVVLVVREWIQAQRTRVTVEIPEVGKFQVDGPGDIDALVALLDSREGD